MTVEEFKIILNKYEKTDKEYYKLLMRIMFFCTGDFYAILEKAEQSNKKLYLTKDTQAEMEKEGLMPESFVLLENIGIH